MTSFYKVKALDRYSNSMNGIFMIDIRKSSQKRESARPAKSHGESTTILSLGPLPVLCLLHNEKLTCAVKCSFWLKDTGARAGKFTLGYLRHGFLLSELTNVIRQQKAVPQVAYLMTIFQPSLQCSLQQVIL